MNRWPNDQNTTGAGHGVTLKLCALVIVAPLLVTKVTAPVAAPAGTVAVITAGVLGVKFVATPDVLEAFRLANKVMSAVGRQRRKDAVEPPKWRPCPEGIMGSTLSHRASPLVVVLVHPVVRQYLFRGKV
jgi:hypothetical protein